jgi:hypothetical protein
VTYLITSSNHPLVLLRSPSRSKGVRLVQRQQLRLVFSQSIQQSSAPLKMSLCSSPKRSSKRKDSPFVNKMRELERVSPEYADALGGIADAIFVQIFGAPLE